MKNSVCLVITIMVLKSIHAQMLVAESIPYRFEIDQIVEYDNLSPSYSFNIAPYKIKIRSKIEKKLKDWYYSEGNGYEDEATYNERLTQKIEQFRTEAIHEVGLEAMQNCKTNCFYSAESLKFQITLADFKPFLIGLPLSDVESFRNNADKLEFSNPRLAFSEDEIFVVSYVEIFNPENGKEYFFHNSNEGEVKTPSFNIRLPNTDL